MISVGFLTVLGLAGLASIALVLYAATFPDPEDRDDEEDI